MKKYLLIILFALCVTIADAKPVRGGERVNVPYRTPDTGVSIVMLAASFGLMAAAKNRWHKV
jgi:hypothetical protein